MANMEAYWRQPVLHLIQDSGQVLALWMPEGFLLLGNTDVQARVKGGVCWRREAQDGQASSWRYEHRNCDRLMTLRGEVRGVESGWLMSLTVRNESESLWPSVVVPVCLSLCTTTVFDGKDHTRIWYRSGGQFKALAEQQYDGGLPGHCMVLVKGRTHIERTARHRAKWGFALDTSDDGIMAATSCDGSQVLTMGWQRVHQLQANASAHLACIHANPFLGDLLPGQEATVRGSVLVSSGDLARAREACLSALAANPDSGS